MFGGEGDDVAHGQAAAREYLAQEVTLRRARHGQVALARGGFEASGEVVHVPAAVDGPPRALGGGEVVGEVGVRSDERLRPAHAAAGPPRVLLDIAPQFVEAVGDLAHGIDAACLPTGGEPPATVLVVDAAALDFSNDDAHVWDEDDEIDLVVAPLRHEAHVGDDLPVGRHRIGQRLPDVAFGFGGERRRRHRHLGRRRGGRPARRVLTTSLTDALTRWAEFTLNRPMGWLTPKGQVVHEISRTT